MCLQKWLYTIIFLHAKLQTTCQVRFLPSLWKWSHPQYLYQQVLSLSSKTGCLLAREVSHETVLNYMNKKHFVYSATQASNPKTSTRNFNYTPEQTSGIWTFYRLVVQIPYTLIQSRAADRNPSNLNKTSPSGAVLKARKTNEIGQIDEDFWFKFFNLISTYNTRINFAVKFSKLGFTKR